jgi:O-antigen ligase
MNWGFLYETIYIANRDEGGAQRFELWRTNLQHVANHPLLGMGPAGYAVYNMSYNPEDARSTHNNYFDVLAQTGVIGFGVFLWMSATFVHLGNQTRRALAGRRDFREAFANATLAGCIGALAAMALGDWLLPFAYNSTIAGFDHASYTWIFLGGMVALHHMVKSSASQANPSEQAPVE